MKNKIIFLLILVVFVFSHNSCKKDDNTEATPTNNNNNIIPEQSYFFKTTVNGIEKNFQISESKYNLFNKAVKVTASLNSEIIHFNLFSKISFDSITIGNYLINNSCRNLFYFVSAFNFYSVFDETDRYIRITNIENINYYTKVITGSIDSLSCIDDNSNSVVLNNTTFKIKITDETQGKALSADYISFSLDRGETRKYYSENLSYYSNTSYPIVRLLANTELSGYAGTEPYDGITIEFNEYPPTIGYKNASVTLYDYRYDSCSNIDFYGVMQNTLYISEVTNENGFYRVKGNLYGSISDYNSQNEKLINANFNMKISNLY